MTALEFVLLKHTRGLEYHLVLVDVVPKAFVEYSEVLDPPIECFMARSDSFLELLYGG